MKLQGKDAANLFEALKIIMKRRVSVGTAVGLRYGARQVKTVIDDTEDMRIELLKRHATLEESGEVVSVDGLAVFASPEDEAAYRADLDELLAFEHDIDWSITVKALGDEPITGNVVWALGDFFIEEDTE